GEVPSLRQITLNFPSNHWQSSVLEILPPGPIGPGLTSPSAFHLPTKYASRACSGPGLAGGCACPTATCRVTIEVRAATVSERDMRCIVNLPGWVTRGST